MAEQTALHNREAASAALTEAMRALQRFKDKPNHNTRILKTKYEAVIAAKEELMSKHFVYAEKSKKALTSAELVDWLTPKMDLADDMIDEVFLLLDNAETQTNTDRERQENAAKEQAKANEVDLATRQSNDEKKRIESLIKTIDESIKDETKTSVGDALLVQSQLEQIDCELEALTKSWNKLKMLKADAEDDELDDIFQAESTLRTSVAALKPSANAYVKKIIPQAAKSSTSSDSSSVVSHSDHSNASLKLEKISLPSFSGNSRTFASFKGDFKLIVEKAYPDVVQRTYVLKKNCLKGPAKTLVENIDSLKDVWERLESKYGNTNDIIHMVTTDLKKLTFQRNDTDTSLVHFVDVLEKGIQDLTAIDALSEISNTYTVDLLERKLPRKIAEKWLEKIENDKIEAKNKFTEIVKFLKLERKQSERFLQLREKDEVGKKGGNGGDKNNKDPNISGGTFGNSKKCCIIHPNSTHFTRKCKAFLRLTVQERGKVILDAKGCGFCLSNSHIGAGCPFEGQWKNCDVNNCNKPHNRLIHGCGIQELSCATFRYGVRLSITLLLIQDVRTPSGKIRTFWDDGSTLSLIAKSFVERMKLKGILVEYDLITVGNVVTPQKAMLHTITLLDRKGNKHEIKAFQIDNICGDVNAPDMKQFLPLFPGLKLKDIARSSGEIELLVGNCCAPLHPHRIDTNEGLVLYETEFGSGRILGGSRIGVDGSGGEENELLAAVRYCASINMVNLRVSKENYDGGTLDDLGIKIAGRCIDCKGCKNCSFLAHELSRVEQYQHEVIKSNLVLDPVNDVITTTYPFQEDPKVLEDNKNQAFALLKKTENRLKPNPSHAQLYCEQWQDFIDRGVVSVITEEEDREYQGPVFYVSHHEIFKPGSTSTPIRIVINSSLQYKGKSPNDILMKGPNFLQNMYGIQLRFREHKYVIVCDMSKMYHSVHTTVVEKHIRRILWRNMEVDRPPTIYGFNRVTFGDKPAGAICAAAVQLTADTYSHIDKDAAMKIKRDGYVDDIATGAETMERIDEIEKNISKILSKGNFFPKGFVKSGDRSAEKLALLGSGDIGRVLGLPWDPETDEFVVTVRINVSKKHKGLRTEPDLTYEEIPRLLAIKLTRSILLGIANSCYDVHGFLGPLLIPLRIGNRDLHKKELNLKWETPIPHELKEKWVKMLQTLKEAEKLRFARCVKPPDAVGNPVLMMCNDASKDAMCCTAHLRWKLESGDFACKLYCAKTRVTPLDRESTPRNEMQSLVMSVRLSSTVIHHTTYKFDDVHYFLDSQCTLATLHKDSMALREFMGNRVPEILGIAPLEKIYHVPSKKNIADLGTRCNATCDDIAEGSDWRNGQPWMSAPEEEWPTSQDITGVKVPEEELIKHAKVGHASAVLPLVDMERLKGRSLTLVLRVVALVLKIVRQRSFVQVKPSDLTSTDIEAAEQYCVKQSMRYTDEDLRKGKLDSLRPKVTDEGVVVLASRAQEGLKVHYDREEFPILMYRDPHSHLWMKHVHEEDHSGITRTVAKSRRKYWVVRGRRLAEKIKYNCYRCRFLDIRMMKQQMAPIPRCRLVLSPPFYITSMDLFGPKWIKDSVKQRTKKKVWGVIYNCAATRAIHLDLTEDYGTDAILQSIQRFTDIRGCPGEIISDQGSQLIAAAKDIAELTRGWNWKTASDWATNNRIKWTVVPAEGQHQNGLSESLIKSVKRSLKHTIGENLLTFAEFQTVLYRVANIINSRPIGVITGSDPTDPKPLTPNDLLLGHSTGDAPQGLFDTDTGSKAITRRYRFVQELVSNWWENWYRVVLPSLVPSHKWLQRHRNVQIGDICLIRYGKDKRATYRLGRVEEVKQGVDGLVRKVSLKYKLPGEKTFRTVDRPIHGIAVIVPVEEQSNDTEIVQPDAVINNNDAVVPVINYIPVSGAGAPVSGADVPVINYNPVSGAGTSTSGAVAPLIDNDVPVSGAVAKLPGVGAPDHCVTKLNPLASTFQSRSHNN